ncbi:hypothetical protein A2W45_01235 [Candidatus Curtissbacteria bacterium RIFCSPHIGHO2_12_41_11]|uniref:Uncharacterized protein n=2 Tax=Candidatus Curtissiibacteriota TaxID=1752717 RepID=A0A1F5H2L4_9BACT|nr:MAG: hypothetical protein A3D07_00415 [Candidatus Curtissbacteria bacterium RIFCSPHIGHO2_02_FULL_42_15]OGD98304.1 MAG: hypothetical protein A2W45_01235 [Candidatus Curtissbacteria bacterium RIFCSPHIGHO2_12_41_11]
MQRLKLAINFYTRFQERLDIMNFPKFFIMENDKCLQGFFGRLLSAKTCAGKLFCLDVMFCPAKVIAGFFQP